MSPTIAPTAVRCSRCQLFTLSDTTTKGLCSKCADEVFEEQLLHSPAGTIIDWRIDSYQERSSRYRAPNLAAYFPKRDVQKLAKAIHAHAPIAKKEETRVCTFCHQEKSLSGFHKDKKGVGGYTSKCKACRCAVKRAYDARRHLSKTTETE